MVATSELATGPPVVDSDLSHSPVDLLVLSVWCGLAAGELEVIARVVHRALSSTKQLYLMTPALRLVGPADQSGAVPRAWRVADLGDSTLAPSSWVG